MSILVNKDTKVIAQGITGRFGTFHSQRMMEYGTKIVAGVTPGKGGLEVNGVPVYDTLEEALRYHDADATITFVPALFTKEAILEAIDANIRLISVVVEGMPVKDMMIVKKVLEGTKTILIGPNSPGVITAEECSIGFFPGDIYRKGPVGIVSRSGTFSYQVADDITKIGLGQTSSVGIGGDPITGISFIDILKLYENDDETKVIVLIGEIGRTSEEEAAEYIKSEVTKPVVAIIGGRTAPAGKTMGHAGAIITGDKGSYTSKEKAFERAGVPVAKTTKEVAKLVKEALNNL
ncbi:MAG: succinate--CoA ligase subunit alpha [Deltaproteobacteria bacterium]|nr:succinate--CoA ligase subunit alpha [Deltaproteobacteria bacterium]